MSTDTEMTLIQCSYARISQSQHPIYLSWVSNPQNYTYNHACQISEQSDMSLVDIPNL
ncbi:hypothetical protein B0H34DRAFT_696935 [Crassisporium funariophilum]|nr:hypothetical protein B0H34DRAFT_696935 [Crassisporium funariophilum]